VRFTLHGSGSLIGIQIDWAAPVERSPELRAAMRGHDVDKMQAGALRKGYQAGLVMYVRGTTALRVAGGHEIFLQRPASDTAAAKPKPVAPVATVATIETRDDVDHHQVVVGDELTGERLDRAISRAVPSLSRAVVQRLIEAGHVTVGGVAAPKNHRLRAGDVVALAHTRALPPTADA